MKPKGVVLIFVLFAIVPLIWLIGLIVDLGRYFIVVRQLQNAADSAAMAGIYMLRSCTPGTNTCSVPYHKRSCGTSDDGGVPPQTLDGTGLCGENMISRGGWIAVKPAMAEMISRQRFLNADMSGFNSVNWNDGEQTKFDSAPWTRTNYDGSATNATLKVAVNRWHECVDLDIHTKQGESVDSDLCVPGENLYGLHLMKKYIGIDPIYDDPEANVEVRKNIDSQNGWIDEDRNSSSGSCEVTRFTGVGNNLVNDPNNPNKSLYCIANAITVSISYPAGTFPFYWVRLFYPGFKTTQNAIQRTATSIMRYPWCYGLPICAEARNHVINQSPSCPVPKADGNCTTVGELPGCGPPNLLWTPTPTPTPII